MVFGGGGGVLASASQPKRAIDALCCSVMGALCKFGVASNGGVLVVSCNGIAPAYLLFMKTIQRPLNGCVFDRSSRLACCWSLVFIRVTCANVAQKWSREHFACE